MAAATATAVARCICHKFWQACRSSTPFQGSCGCCRRIPRGARQRKRQRQRRALGAAALIAAAAAAAATLAASAVAVVVAASAVAAAPAACYGDRLLANPKPYTLNPRVACRAASHSCRAAPPLNLRCMRHQYCSNRLVARTCSGCRPLHPLMAVPVRWRWTWERLSGSHALVWKESDLLED
eukprot:60811-Chlamydomonas_euryale.AAC.17